MFTQLENEIERLRDEVSMSKVGDRAETESLRDLLSGTRKDLDAERLKSGHLKKEIEKLRSRIEELQVQIENKSIVF